MLFTDMVGSTERAAELGDRAWRDLLERHHAVVRRELKAFQGREIDTAGDGFFAVFEAPERAVRCAESILTSVASLGLQLRAGVHTGECEVVDGKLAGMAVHIGSRVAALAGAGEVLVTGSVRDLMTGSDRRFDGGQPRQLKGVADPWPVYRLLPADTYEEAHASRRSSMLPLYTRRHRRRLRIGLAAVLVLALSGSAVYVLTRPALAVVVQENSVGVIGSGDGTQVSAAVSVGQRPTGLVGGAGSVWVTNSSANSVSRIDPRSNVALPIPVGANPAGIAFGSGSVWVANSGNATVSRIDPSTSVATIIAVRPGPTGIVVARGKVWVTNSLDAAVSEIDPGTNEVVDVIPVGSGPSGIAFGAGALWVTNQADGTVTRIDAVTKGVDDPIPVGKGPIGVAFGDGAVWVANNLEGSLSRIDVENHSVNTRTIAKGGGAYAVAASGRNIWVSNEYAGTLSRVESRRFTLLGTVTLNGAPLGMSFIDDQLWFALAANGSALHRGGVITMVGSGVDPNNPEPPVLDPAEWGSDQTIRLSALMLNGLVGYRLTDGAQGSTLVPDLATSLPRPTGAGKTYTFHLRRGLRYSDGTPVRAGDIRRAIERSVLQGNNSGHFVSAIVGADACAKAAERAEATKHRLPAGCDLSQGIAIDDASGTVTFHLRRLVPDFLYQLAMPGAAAVPEGTTVEPAPGTILPTTGPYMVTSYLPKPNAIKGKAEQHGRLVLERNPYFDRWAGAGQPRGYADRIVLETGYSTDEALQRVATGRADYFWDRLPTNEIQALKTRYGPQLHSSPGTGTRYVFLNASKPPFNNVDARRAVAFALDRAALAKDPANAGPVTCQVIPPGFTAYEPYCPYTLGVHKDGTWTGPDVASAQKLVRASGTTGATVVVGVYDAQFRYRATQTVAVLRSLGYQASWRLISPDLFFSAKGYEVGLSGWGAEYPAASDFLTNLSSCNPDLDALANLTHFCDEDIEKGIASALDLQTREPAAASDAWAAVDRKVVDAAAIIPYANIVQQNFVSRRVGNVLVHPEFGLLLAQMWVQ